MSLTKVDIRHMKRWITASVIELFKATASGIHLFVEGMDPNTNKKDKHFELRIDGPYSKPLSRGEYRHYVEINLLANSTRAENDFYDRQNLQGIAAEMLNRDICVYRMGNCDTKPEIDDKSLVGTLQLLASDMIKVSDFGKIQETVEVYQSAVEAHYEMYTSEDVDTFSGVSSATGIPPFNLEIDGGTF